MRDSKLDWFLDNDRFLQTDWFEVISTTTGYLQTDWFDVFLDNEKNVPP